MYNTYVYIYIYIYIYIIIVLFTVHSQPINMQVKGDGDFKVTFENDVAIITMCKGENKINIEFIEQMCAALDKVLE